MFYTLTVTNNLFLLQQHTSFKSSDTENFSVNIDVDDDDDMSTDDDDDVSVCFSDVHVFTVHSV